MIAWFKRKTDPPDFSAIGTDIHSHLLPGIDDGSPDVETSFRLIHGLQELGFTKFVTTPHILWDLYRNDDNTIAQAHNELNQAAKQNGKDLPPITAAAEYMIDDHFAQLIKDKTPLRTIRDRYVLVEFSFVALPFQWKELIFELQLANYNPILAHPERYGYMSNQVQVFEEMANMGIALQMNLLSLTGYYGKQPQNLAQYLLKKNLISFVGTDLHHERHLDALRSASGIMQQLDPLVQSGKLLNFYL